MRLFQAIDDRGDCIAYCYNHKIHSDIDFGEFDGSWSVFKEAPSSIEFASIYAKTDDIKSVCPAHLKDRFSNSAHKIKSCRKALKKAKISEAEHCFYDLMPEHYLIEYFGLKNAISEHVLTNYTKPKNYDHLYKIQVVRAHLQNYNFKLDARKSAELGSTALDLYKKYKDDSFAIYDIWNVITGRLAIAKNSFPIMNISKENRKIILPKNDAIVEIDINAHQIRTALALMDKPLPPGDFYNHIQPELNTETRAATKKRFFAWFYGSEENKGLDRYFDRDAVVEKYWDGEFVRTIHGREIPADHFHAFNYIVQTTANDLFMESLYEIVKILEGKETKLMAAIHDSVLLDLDLSEKYLVRQIADKLEDTRIGKLKCSASVGHNFGEMEKIKI
jgi:hypothetical protein